MLPLKSLRLLARTAAWKNAFYRQTRLLNCHGETNEMTGLVLGVFGRDDEDLGQTRVYTESTEKFDKEVDGKLTDFLRHAGPTPKPGEYRMFYGLDPRYSAVNVVGIGDECLTYNELEELDELKEAIRNATGLGARVLQEHHMRNVEVDTMGSAESAAEGSAMSVWLFQDMKSKQMHIPKYVFSDCIVEDLEGQGRWTLSALGPLPYNLYTSYGDFRITPYDTCDYTGWQIGLQKAAAQNLTRQLAETPANILTPSGFAQMAVQVLTKNGVSVEVKVKEWSAIMDLHGYLAAAQGSCEPPVFVEVHYYGCDPDVPPAILVGKGVTFDSGGLCLKDCPDMKWMRGDMSGAASVVATAKAVAALRLPINLRGLMPLYENMPGACAMKPGDIIRGKSGKSVLINNTDYDGRLALSDAMTYAGIYNPKFITSIATSSETLIDTFGEGPVSVFTENESLFEMMRIAGMHTGDRVWRLPLWRHFKEKISRSPFSDTQDRDEQYPAIDRTVYTGLPPQTAAFLREFVPATDWIHVDTYNVVVTDGRLNHYLRPGMSGRPTRTIIEFLAQLACHVDENVENKQVCP